MQRAGLSLQSHGHSSGDELVGNVYIKGAKPAAWPGVAWSIYHDEPLSTGSGHIMKIPGMDKMWEGVSDIGQRVLDVSISFFQSGAVRDFVDKYPLHGS